MEERLRILHLEDKEIEAEIIQASLADEGLDCEVTWVETRAGFMAALDRGCFDLILSDYTLPDFGGRAALELALQQCPDVPFIFVSGTIGEDTAIELVKNGATDYVLKNKLSRLVPAVQRALREAREKSERKQANERLGDSELRYRRLFESAKDGILILDADTGMVVYVNPFLLQLIGYSYDELCGMHIWELGILGNIIASKSAFKVLQDKEYIRYDDLPLKTRDGQSISVEFVSNVYLVNHGKVIQCNIRDMTERKLTLETLRVSEETARQMAKESELIADVGKIISSTLNIEEVYAQFAEKVREAIPFDRISISIINMKNYTRTIKYVSGLGSTVNIIGKVHPIAGTRTEQAVLTKSGLLFNRNDKEEDLARNIPGVAFPAGVSSLMIVPLILKGEVIGSWAIQSVKINAYSEQKLYLAERMGSQIAGAIANAQLFLELKQAEGFLKETLEHLKRAIDTTIQVMVSAVEVRDPYTAGHQIRTADLAGAIAAEIGLPQDKVEGIHMAGVIHDIGKLSVPSEILFKPTKLSEIEFALIKEHPMKGYEMLKDVESPWPLAEIIYQHHERMDGSGYPRNLKGEENLMEARILAVSDVVESMSSHRPYRPSLGNRCSPGGDREEPWYPVRSGGSGCLPKADQGEGL